MLQNNQQEYMSTIQANVLIDSGSVSLVWLITREMVSTQQAEDIRDSRISEYSLDMIVMIDDAITGGV